MNAPSNPTDITDPINHEITETVPELPVAERQPAPQERVRFRRLRHALGACAFAGGGVLLAAGCLLATPPPYQGPEGALKVGLAGDSQLHKAEKGGGTTQNDPDQYLTDQLAASGYLASTTATIGARSIDLSTVNWPDDQIDIAVTVIGTNDAHISEETQEPTVSESTFRTNIRNYFNRIMARCVVVVGIRLSNPWRLDESAPPYNVALQEEAMNRQGPYQDTVYLDWEATSRPLTPSEDFFADDDVHTTDAGAEVFRNAIEDSVDQCAAKIAVQEEIPPVPEPASGS